MANKELFRTQSARADTTNEAGGRAYKRTAQETLATLAATGMLTDQFYTTAEQQLTATLEAASACSPDFVAKTAVYARTRGYMKDMPALLVAWLFVNAFNKLAEDVFPRTIDNGRMVRNLVQILRSGQLGRKSIPRPARRILRKWLNNTAPEYIFRSSVGKDPSIADVIKMVRPKPTDRERAALFAYLIGKSHEPLALPQLVQDYEAFKRSVQGDADNAQVPMPAVPFQMVDFLPLSKKRWAELLLGGGWQFVRMNLNTGLRHGVFEDEQVTAAVAMKLRSPELVKKARQFPFQLYSALKNIDSALPYAVRAALEDALDVALGNVPALRGPVVVAIDCSGSMQHTMGHTFGGAQASYRRGSGVMITEIAALFAAAMVRTNPETRVLMFDQNVREIAVNPRDTIETLTKNMTFCGGATDCAAPLRHINAQGSDVGTFVILSDNQSWAEHYWGRSQRSGSADEWLRMKKRCPNAKQVRIDLAPYGSTQVPAGFVDTLSLAGFSDAVFDVVSRFTEGNDANAWIREIEAIDIWNKTS